MADTPRDESTTQHDLPAIRRAKREDAAGIGRVHARSQHATYRGIVSPESLSKVTPEERARWWTRALTSHDENWLNLVAEVGGEIVGFSCTGPAGLSEGSTVAAYDLYCLYLAPEWERRGIGARLTSRTFAWLRQRGVVDVQVLCLAATDARLFYEAMGGFLVEEAEHEDGGLMLAHRIYRYELLVGDA